MKTPLADTQAIGIQVQQNLPVPPERVSLTIAIAGRAAQRIRHHPVAVQMKALHHPEAVQEEAILRHGLHPVALQVHGLAGEGINHPVSNEITIQAVPHCYFYVLEYSGMDTGICRKCFTI